MFISESSEMKACSNIIAPRRRSLIATLSLSLSLSTYLQRTFTISFENKTRSNWLTCRGGFCRLVWVTVLKAMKEASSTILSPTTEPENIFIYMASSGSSFKCQVFQNESTALGAIRPQVWLVLFQSSYRLIGIKSRLNLRSPGWATFRRWLSLWDPSKYEGLCFKCVYCCLIQSCYFNYKK